MLVWSLYTHSFAFGVFFAAGTGKMVRVEQRWSGLRKGKEKAEWSKSRGLLSKKKNLSRVLRSPEPAKRSPSNVTMTLAHSRNNTSVLGTMSMSGPARNLTLWASNPRSLVAFGSCHRIVSQCDAFFFWSFFFKHFF